AVESGAGSGWDVCGVGGEVGERRLERREVILECLRRDHGPRVGVGGVVVLVVGGEDLVGEVEVVLVRDLVEVPLEQRAVFSFRHANLLGRTASGLGTCGARGARLRSYFGAGGGNNTTELTSTAPALNLHEAQWSTGLEVRSGVW